MEAELAEEHRKADEWWQHLCDTTTAGLQQIEEDEKRELQQTEIPAWTAGVDHQETASPQTDSTWSCLRDGTLYFTASNHDLSSASILAYSLALALCPGNLSPGCRATALFAHLDSLDGLCVGSAAPWAAHQPQGF